MTAPGWGAREGTDTQNWGKAGAGRGPSWNCSQTGEQQGWEPPPAGEGAEESKDADSHSSALPPPSRASTGRTSRKPEVRSAEFCFLGHRAGWRMGQGTEISRP